MSEADGRAGLSRDAILDVATRLVSTGGLDAVTMRAVAKELDVTPMALYYYVPNKDVLVSLIAERVVADRGELTLGDAGWEEALRVHLMGLWENLRRYPGLASYMFNLPTLGMSADSYKSATTFFEEAGFPPRAAHLAWSFAWTYIHGRLSVDSRIDRAASRAAGTGSIRARDHVRFGIEAVILALQAVLADPSRALPE